MMGLCFCCSKTSVSAGTGRSGKSAPVLAWEKRQYAEVRDSDQPNVAACSDDLKKNYHRTQ